MTVMPIVDVELVCRSEAEPAGVSARRLADVLGAVFQSGPGRTWVRLRFLPAAAYAENDSTNDDDALPVFVCVLQAYPAQGAALAEQVRAVTAAVAECVGRPMARVHVRYEPAAAGRQAFGGTLVGNA